MRVAVLAWVALLAPGVALAAPGTERVVVVTPEAAFTPHAGPVSSVLYLERCVGGCMIRSAGINDAQSGMTTIPMPGLYGVTEFATFDGMTGSAADADWNGVVRCMQEVYSPFAITVTDVRPTDGTYTEAMIAGQPSDLGLNPNILGIAPIVGNCKAQDNVISFSFSNHHPAQDRVNNICWTASQESAHAFGLDHEFEFLDGSSACNSPMTYRTDCGGQKFFRNKEAKCGTDAVAKCRCSATQNSHATLVSLFGEGTPITTPPHAEIVFPLQGAQIMSNTVFHATAGAQRGVTKVELFLNGSKWTEVKGAPFGVTGQVDPSPYTIYLPAGVPDSLIDAVVVAHDDLGNTTESAPITVVKGASCLSAATCAHLQKCEDGRCFWDPPTGELGDDCTFSQGCKSWACLDTGDGQRCTQDCVVGDLATCPVHFACAAPNGRAICVTDSGGCCSVGGGTPPVHGILAGGVLALVLRRRRR